ncbi:MAG: hypothetical protein U0L98_03475 [Clostridia bacterium]|nr:hypothetical protein [Clostridia bacterium]
MEIFDMIGKKASEAYKITADKTGKLAKETKIKLRMGEIKSKTNEIYQEIGKKVYEKHVREEDISIKEDLEEECTKLDVLSDEMESLLNQCLELRDKKQCPSCFAKIDKDMNYCSNCGLKQEKEEVSEENIVEDEKAKEVEIIETSNDENKDNSNEE